MSGVALAVGVGSAAAGMYGASQQADAQKDAAETAAGANRAGQQITYNQWLQQQANQQPWLTAGTRGIDALSLAMGLLTPEQLAQSLSAQNASTFDADAFLAAHPKVTGTSLDGQPLGKVISDWGLTPYQYYEQYGRNQGMDFTYKPGYGPEAAGQLTGEGSPYGSLYGSLTKPFTSQDFLNNQDPGYGWRKQEGINALAASGAASGNYGSGNMGTALENYGQNLASNEYQNAYNRWNQQQTNLYNRLAGIAGSGQTASNQLGAEGAQAANNMAAYGVGAANALGAGQVGAANAWASGYGNLANQGMGLANQFLNRQQNPANGPTPFSGGGSGDISGFGGWNGNFGLGADTDLNPLGIDPSLYYALT
jgi:hypothetical protein